MTIVKAGRLDRIIVIMQPSETIDAAGAVHETWNVLAPMRAQLIQPQSGTSDVSHDYGSTSDATMYLQTRYIGGLTLNDQVTFEGSQYLLREIKEIGRRRGLELKIERIGP